MTLAMYPPPGTGDSPPYVCGVAAQGVVEVRRAELAALREQPGTIAGRPIPPKFLRHADEHTVAGLAAVLRAASRFPDPEGSFGDWGVLAAPQFPGRIGGAAALTKFRQAGPSSFSPHVIPQYSLHSAAGAISIALGAHGPSFGIGGGPEALAEALTLAPTLFDSGAAAGLWLVLSQWDTEPVPDGQGASLADSLCRAVALALVADGGPGWSLRLEAAAPVESRGQRETGAAGGMPARDAGPRTGKPPVAPAASPLEGPSLAGLAAWLSADPCEPQPAPWSCLLPWGGRIELSVQVQQQRRAA